MIEAKALRPHDSFPVRNGQDERQRRAKRNGGAEEDSAAVWDNRELRTGSDAYAGQ